MIEPLFDEFNVVTSREWKQKIQVDLQGKDYNEHLIWESPEGIKTKPFYRFEDRNKIDSKTSIDYLSWSIAQEIFVKDPLKSNKKAIKALGRGAEHLFFTIPSKTIDIAILLAHIDLSLVHIHFNFRFLSVDYISRLIAFSDSSSFNLHFHVDSIGQLARTGNWFFDLKKDFEITEAILKLTAKNTESHTIGIDASLYQNAGADIVQQLAYALAHANEYLNGFTPNVNSIFSFKVAVGSNYFFEIAKIRALRHLWAIIAAEYGATTPCYILAVPSRRNFTLYAYNMNLLRSTTACMSAIVGGANVICNLSYDAIYNKENEFAERIARNQLLILKEESFFDAIENPASGSYYIESLTQQLAEKALLLFKDIEANGGFLKQLKTNTIQRKLKESADKEQHLFDTKKNILVGTNAYRSPTDVMSDVLKTYPFQKVIKRETLLEPIIEKRLSEQNEKARLKKEGWNDRSKNSG